MRGPIGPPFPLGASDPAQLAHARTCSVGSTRITRRARRLHTERDMSSGFETGRPPGRPEDWAAAKRSWLPVLLTAVYLVGGGCSGPVEEEDTSEAEIRRFDRVAHARVYQQHHWTLPNRDADYVGEHLAKLRPTYVTGLVRLETPSRDPADYADQAAAYDRIRTIVRRESPNARFDIVLNMLPKQYGSPQEIRRSMTFLDDLFQPDGWFFDFLDNGKEEVIAAAVQYAKSHDQFIAGNLNGGGGRVPRGINFVAITDGTDIGEHVANLRRSFSGPVLVHIENNPQHNNGDNAGAVFLEGGAQHRKEHIERLAQRAKRSPRYTLMYPVFYPLYPHEERGFQSYDAVRDEVLPLIKRLMGVDGND
jgi:hypothetical protein